MTPFRGADERAGVIGRRSSLRATFVVAAVLLLAQVVIGGRASFGNLGAVPAIHTKPDWYVALDRAHGRTTAANLAWLERGTVPGAGTAYESMVRSAILDLHRLSSPDGAMAAGPAGKWAYDWPRDTAFVAVALARSGHRDDALAMLGWLGARQRPDGLLEARYRLDGSGVPDARPAQADGPGWVLWAVGAISTGEEQAEPRGARDHPARRADDLPPAVRTLATRSLDRLLRQTDHGRRLPPATPDYWEVPQTEVSLGEAAPVLAGLQSASSLFARLGDPRRAADAHRAADRFAGVVDDAFGPTFQRYGDRGGRDAALAMLMPPFVRADGRFGTRRGESGRRLAAAWTDYQDGALRAGGGLAPGTAWLRFGESWTPETALVAYSAAASGRTVVARRWMDWLSAHRTPWGALPEKVMADGRPAGPAPLAWTGALVVLTADELDRRP
jgi:GH15 family glucan-1,4-alpha-glucosidase